MAKITATHKCKLTVRAPLSNVYSFFVNPVQLRELTPDVENFQLLSESQAKWRLTEKVEKGVRYAAEYTVNYQGNGSDEVKWHSIDGNMDIDGEVSLRSLGENLTEFQFRETVAPDLPISRLTAMIFKPIVARELRQDIGTFLDRAVEYLGGAAERDIAE